MIEDDDDDDDDYDDGGDDDDNYDDDDDTDDDNDDHGDENKSPLLVSYLFSIGDPRHPSPLCPLCLMHDHTSSHLFECKSLPTSLSSLDLWTNPDKVEPFLATWGERLLAAT